MCKNKIVYGAFIGILIMQNSCMHNDAKNGLPPIVKSNLTESPARCHYDPLDYYNASPASPDTESITEAADSTSIETETEACIKLREAIILSMPDSKNQNDKMALDLLKELKQTATLSNPDARFANQLFLQLQQRMELRNLIGSQVKKRLHIEAENRTLKSQLDTLQSQLNQLKNIEIEIERKERSVISPIGE